MEGSAKWEQDGRDGDGDENQYQRQCLVAES